MRSLIKKFIASLLPLSILVLGFCTPLSIADDASHVLATGDVNIRSAPNTDAAILGVLFKDEKAEYLDGIFIDSRGIAWFKISHDNIEGWVSAKYSTLIDLPESTDIVDSAAPLADHPDFYDGYIFEMTGSHQARIDGQPDNGLNDVGALVNWQLAIYEVKPGTSPGFFLACPAPELVFCSWDDDIPLNTSGQLDSVWDLIRKGETLQETALTNHWPGEYEIRTYETVVYMPDNPEIEGPQQLVYLTDNEALIFDFQLLYNGGYSGHGLGWNMRDVQFTKCSLEEYENRYNRDLTPPCQE